MSNFTEMNWSLVDVNTAFVIQTSTKQHIWVCAFSLPPPVWTPGSKPRCQQAAVQHPGAGGLRYAVRAELQPHVLWRRLSQAHSCGECRRRRSTLRLLKPPCRTCSIRADCSSLTSHLVEELCCAATTVWRSPQIRPLWTAATWSSVSDEHRLSTLVLLCPHLFAPSVPHSNYTAGLPKASRGSSAHAACANMWVCAALWTCVYPCVTMDALPFHSSLLQLLTRTESDLYFL